MSIDWPVYKSMCISNTYVYMCTSIQSIHTHISYVHVYQYVVCVTILNWYLYIYIYIQILYTHMRVFVRVYSSTHERMHIKHIHTDSTHDLAPEHAHC